ncbi:P1 family peptidase [Parasphingorhabdus pacifica]
MGRSGPRNAIVDVAGVRVGHHGRLDERWATGCSVVLVPDGAVAAVDVRGGGPGTRETDVLDPTHLVQRAHAVVLSGGSAYGLAAADGAMRWLEAHGHGLQVGAEPGEVVPVVPSAVLFDLPMGAWGNRPDAEFGHRACEAATDTEVREGNVGAGTGAVAGFLKGGTGTASSVLDDGTTVGALVAVNSAGSVIDPETGLPWAGTGHGLRPPDAAEVAVMRDRSGDRPGRHGQVGRPLNTTIGVVATDRELTKAECDRVAVAAQDGLARAVRPAHAMTDGDTIFALATGGRGRDRPVGADGWAGELDELCAVAADVVATAIVRAVLAAEPVGEVTSYTRAYPSVRE